MKRRRYLLKIEEIGNLPSVREIMKTTVIWLDLALKIRGKEKQVFGRIQRAKNGKIYLIDKRKKVSYGPGTKILAIN